MSNTPTSSAINAKLAARLGKLIPRLASEAEGEVVATVRAIQAALRAEGRDLHDLAAALTGTPIEKAAPVAQLSPAPTWKSMSLFDARGWMDLIFASSEVTEPQRERLTDMANRLRLGMYFTVPWQRARLFDELVARLHAKGSRL